MDRIKSESNIAWGRNCFLTGLFMKSSSICIMWKLTYRETHTNSLHPTQKYNFSYKSLGQDASGDTFIEKILGLQTTTFFWEMNQYWVYTLSLWQKYIFQKWKLLGLMSLLLGVAQTYKQHPMLAGHFMSDLTFYGHKLPAMFSELWNINHLSKTVITKWDILVCKLYSIKIYDTQV